MSIPNLDAEWDAWVSRCKPKAPEVLDVFQEGDEELLVLAPNHQTFLPARSHHDAYVELRKLLRLAKREILIVDAYVDETIWELLTSTEPEVNIRILTDNMKGDFRLEAAKFAKQYGRAVEIRKSSTYHDRFIIADGERCWHVGASIKDAGSKAFAFSELIRRQIVEAAISDVNMAWSSAAVVAQL